MKMVSEKIKAIWDIGTGNWDIRTEKCHECDKKKTVKRSVCEKCYNKQNYIKKRDHSLRLHKEYYQKNKEKRNRYSKQYYLEHKNYFQEYYKKYYKKNKESIFTFLDSEDLAKDTLLSGT